MTMPSVSSVMVIAFEPVRILEPAVEQAQAQDTGTPMWVWIAGAVVALALIVALGVLATAMITAYRRVRALHPAEDAFRSVCKALRIPPADWPAIRTLAAKIDAAPVAILISRSAFDRALGSRAPTDAIATLRSRIFGDDGAQ